jgi:predicted acylesterase/phospholipase RssA
MEEQKLDTFDTLVLSGGGLKCISLLGAIEYARQKKLLDGITNYVGTSAGSLISYLLCIGYTPMEITTFICGDRITSDVKTMDLVSMMSGCGATSFTYIQEQLEKLTVKKIGRYLTLGGLKKEYGKTLICCTFNLTADKTEYIGPDTHSDIPCLTAVKMSCSLPLIFPHFEYMGSFYIDGGITKNFPIRYGAEVGNKVLGLCIDPTSGIKFSADNSSLLNYIYKIMFIPVNRNTVSDIEDAPDNCTIINIKSHSNKLIFDLNFDITETLEIFSRGYREIREFYE